jgi:hypothetical protein
MYREYERQLNYSDFLTEGAHNRTGVYMYTKDKEVIEEKIKLGWCFCEVPTHGFMLRSPDISLIDIAEPFRVHKVGSNVLNLSLYRHLNKMKESGILYPFMKEIVDKDDYYKNFRFYISEGPALESEIRIGGSDIRINRLKDDILKKSVKSSTWKKEIEYSNWFLGKTRTLNIYNKTINQFDPISRKFLKSMENIKMKNYPLSEKISMKIVHGIIEQLPEFDELIFIPKGCFRYITSFIDDTTVDNIMLWEIHIEYPDIIKKFFQKNLKDKKCLIIDKSYTGQTLTKMAEMIKNEGGTSERLALFPKSKMAVEKSEYALILDKVIKSETINTNLDGWSEHVYKKILLIN